MLVIGVNGDDSEASSENALRHRSSVIWLRNKIIRELKLYRAEQVKSSEEWKDKGRQLRLFIFFGLKTNLEKSR